MKLLQSNHKQILLTMVAALLLMTSCDFSDKLYHSCLSTPQDGWGKGDSIKFTTPEVTESGQYSVTIFIKTNGKYPYRDLWLIVNNDFQRHGQPKDQQLRVQITTPKGDTKGKGINFYQYEVPFAVFTLKKGNAYQAKIVHDLRQSTVKGITDVGIIIKKVKTD